MRSFDFTPFYRSTIGFERLFDTLDNGPRSDWPPYDIEKLAEDKYRITMAVAGFSAAEIEMTQEGTNLFISGKKAGKEDRQVFLHKGIAQRSFSQSFSLAEHVRVVGANLENGLLAIDLLREVPEQLKPRKIEIGLPQGRLKATQPKQIDQAAKAA